MTKEEISQIADVNEGLENSIKLASTTCKTIDEIIDKVSTKRYTKTRISRILTYILLDITKSDMEQSKNNDPYIRVLGINKKCEEILSTINNNKLITSLKKFEENNGENELLNIDKKATGSQNAIYFFERKIANSLEDFLLRFNTEGHYFEYGWIWRYCILIIWGLLIPIV